MPDSTTIKTSRFGDLTIEKSGIIIIKGGLLGFPGQEKFVLVNAGGDSPFQWLQSAEAAELAFVVVDPRLVEPSYRVEVQRDIIDTLDIKDLDGSLVFAIVTLNKDPQKVTANLLGPIIINPANGQGRQVVLAESIYTARHKLLS